ncbi:MAG: hypothetical protein IKO10_09170 [Lachnospiraceae bacterium]|nr:hypothetical protein [Lachnospiraceae bacterium]
MQFRFDFLENGKKRDFKAENKWQKRKSLLCFFMLLVFFCNGCGSIILSGDLQFDANAPIEPMQLEEQEEYMDSVVFGYTSNDRYEIGGTRAFVTLNGHVSPSDVPAINSEIRKYNDKPNTVDKKELRGDFEVIDYNAHTGCFIYAYYTPYFKDAGTFTQDAFPEVTNCGVSANEMTGSADDLKVRHPQSDNELDGNVLTLMSYNPATKKYKVFFSCTYTADENAANDMRLIAGKAGMAGGLDKVQGSQAVSGDELNISSTGEIETAMGENKHNYFVFAHDYLYLFDENGDKIFSTNYANIIEMKAREMSRHYGNYANWRYTVTDVEIDGKGIPYFTLSLEVSNKDFKQADAAADAAIQNDEEIEDSEDSGDGANPEKVGDIIYYHGTFGCLRAPIGGRDGISFLSTLNDDAKTVLEKSTLLVSANEVKFSNERGIAETKTDPSTNEVIEEIKETYAQTLKRLKELPDTDSRYQNPPDLIGPYLQDPSVNAALNSFTDFTSSKSDVTYVLAGGAAGRVIKLYDSKGVEQDYFKYYNPQTDYLRARRYAYSYGSLTTSGWYRYDFGAGCRWLQLDHESLLLRRLNYHGYVIPALKPGVYGGLDWAYYNIGDYKEENGQYGLNGGALIRGHAQPLVSSGIYTISGSYGFYNYHYDNILVRDHNDEQENFLVNSSGKMYRSSLDESYDYGDPPVEDYYGFHHGIGWNWNGQPLRVASRYYYNNTLDNDYKLRISENYTGTQAGCFPTEIHLAYMLINNCPYVTVRREYEDGDGTLKGEYLSIRNSKDNVFVLPVMTMQETATIQLKYQYWLKDDVSGNQAQMYHETVQELKIPVQYKMQFPEGSFIQIDGETWIGNYVKSGDTELTALTYYSMNGQRLYIEDVSSRRYMSSLWYWFYNNANYKSKYPIYDNATDTTMDTNDVYISWFGWWYGWRYNSTFWSFYTGENSKKMFSTLQVEKQGVDGPIYDRLVPGEAKDLAIWKVPVNVDKPADGEENVVAYFTDQVIRFYKKNSSGKYRALAEVRIEDLRGLNEGYLLKEMGEAVKPAAENTTIDQKLQAASEEALYEDDVLYQLDSKNILPIDSSLKKFLYFSGDGGIHILYLTDNARAKVDASDTRDQSYRKEGRIMNLLKGTYYGVYRNGSGNNYKVVGFQTQENNYTGADLCMAKVYDLNMSQIIAEHGSTALEEYLESLRNLYLTKTHTIKRTVNSAGVEVIEIIKPNEEDAEYKRAKIIMEGTDAQAEAEVDKICQEYGMTKSSTLVDCLKSIRTNFQNQRKAITEMYEFLGIDATALKDNGRYLAFEGRIFNASYEAILEQTMVEIVLSDFYLDPDITPRLNNNLSNLVGIRQYDDNDILAAGEKRIETYYVDEYAQLRKDYKQWIINNTKLDTIYQPVTTVSEDRPSERGWYVKKGDDYEQTTDETPVSGTTYYAKHEVMYREITPDGTENPKAQSWYEASGKTYVLTSDTTINKDKTYYMMIDMTGQNALLNGAKISATLYQMMDVQSTLGITGMDFYKEVSDDLELRYIRDLESGVRQPVATPTPVPGR